MSIEVFNRREVKYVISQNQLENLLPLIREHMESDRYNVNNKPYSIYTIQFDTDDNLLITNSLQKPVFKQKVRLRSYGKAAFDKPVFLEIKKKFMHVVNKRRTELSLSEATNYILKRKIPVSNVVNTQVFSEIDYLFKIYPTLAPKVFISYDRLAFFEKNNSDFRLTFDTNIQTRRTNLTLENETGGTPLLQKELWLMEAKAFKAFPLWFVHLLSQNRIYSTSFSKYGREFENYLQQGTTNE